jgi:hypothetical protein
MVPKGLSNIYNYIYIIYIYICSFSGIPVPFSDTPCIVGDISRFAQNSHGNPIVPMAPEVPTGFWARGFLNDM